MLEHQWLLIVPTEENMIVKHMYPWLSRVIQSTTFWSITCTLSISYWKPFLGEYFGNLTVSWLFKVHISNQILVRYLHPRLLWVIFSFLITYLLTFTAHHYYIFSLSALCMLWGGKQTTCKRIIHFKIIITGCTQTVSII